MRRSNVSEFKPVFDLEGARTFFGLDFALIEKRTVELLSRYRSCLKTDISRYYHTIYTHSIPWALYGKAHCKANLHNHQFTNSMGNRLDQAVRQSQQNQTIGIRFNGHIHNYFEVSWALFIAKALRIRLRKADLTEVFKAESSVCGLLAMDLQSRNLIDGGIDNSFWNSFYTSNGLRSSMWLLVYEATVKGWMPPHRPCFVNAHPLFGPMLRKRISFYDDRRNVTTTRKELRRQRAHDRIAKLVFANIDAYF